MPIEESDWIWFSGEWVAWHDAKVHVSAHALHYGSSVFEGIRAYATDDGPSIFRLDRHLERMYDSCKIVQFDMTEYGFEVMSRVCVESVSRNGHESCYIRPLAFRGVENMGVHPLACPVEMAVFSFPWGTYLGEEALAGGVDAQVSSWRRFAPATSAPLGKIGGQYVTNQFVAIEARENGYAEGVERSSPHLSLHRSSKA
jgi:branched-chain amino acid aminotransferase